MCAANVQGTGNFSSLVNWSAQGGTIAGSTYTAPAIIPNPTQVTVTATSVQNPAKSGSAIIKVDPPSNPLIEWVGDVQVSSGLGDHGDGTTVAPALDVLPDGSGGALFIWGDDGNGVVRVQRLDANGNLLWASGGVYPTTFNSYQDAPRAVSDGAGGLIIAWVDGRNGFCGWGFKGNCDIYAQRIDANGNLLWDPHGVSIVTDPANQAYNGFAMVSDGAGGAIIAWEDGRPNPAKIFAQRIHGDGQVAWASDGIRVSPEPTIVLGGIGNPFMVSDGAGGAIISWMNNQYDPLTHPLNTVSAQRIGPGGNLLWAPAGVTVSNLSGGPTSTGGGRVSAVSDSSHGAIFIASHSNAGTDFIIAQRISGTGQVLWTLNGVSVASAPGRAVYPMIAEDGAGGALIAWNSCDVGSAQCVMSIQRLDSAGHAFWPSFGIYLSDVASAKFGPIMAADGAGGAVVAWEDCRNFPDVNQCLFGSDLYAQRVNASGQRLWNPGGFAVSAAPGNQGTNTGGATAGFSLTSDGLGNFFFSWPDGRSSRCANWMPPSRCDLFAQRLHE